MGGDSWGGGILWGVIAGDTVGGDSWGGGILWGVIAGEGGYCGG